LIRHEKRRKHGEWIGERVSKDIPSIFFVTNQNLNNGRAGREEVRKRETDGGKEGEGGEMNSPL